LQPEDLSRALPGILIAALLPGFAMATLLAPRWRAWERLAAAPGLSAGFIGILGLGLRLVHIPFEPLTILPCIAGLVAAAALRWLRTLRDPAATQSWWVPVPALIAGAVAAAVFAVALSGQVLPPDFDAVGHGGLAASITRTHDVLPLFPIPLQHSAFTLARPGFEATAALVSWLGGPPPAMAMTPIVAVTLLLLPLGLTMLALEATGSVALAVTVPLFAAGLAFPSLQAMLGRYPQVIDSTLVVPVIVATVRLIRGRKPLDNALLLAVATASIWVIHGIEALSALVVGGALIAAAAVAALRSSPRRTLARIGAAAVAVSTGALLVTVITRLPRFPPRMPAEPSIVHVAEASGPPDWHAIFLRIAQTDLTGPVALALLVIGVLALLIQRRLLWVLAAEVVLVAVMADDLGYRHLDRLWKAVFPWGNQDRLFGVQYWLIPFILGAGPLAALQVVRALSRERRLRVGATVLALAVALVAVLVRGPIDRLWMHVFGSPALPYPLGIFDGLSGLTLWRLTFVAVAVALIVAWFALSRELKFPAEVRARLGPAAAGFDVAAAAVALVALISLGVGARADLHHYRDSVAIRSLATPADITVLTRMGALLPPHSVVFTNTNDAGLWLTAVTDLTPLVPNGSENGSLSLPLVEALANACNDPTAAAQALQGVDAAFVGAHHWPGTATTWDANCLAQLPGVRIIASAPWQGAEATALAVTHLAP